jgi:hypothetical protein
LEKVMGIENRFDDLVESTLSAGGDLVERFV